MVKAEWNSFDQIPSVSFAIHRSIIKSLGKFGEVRNERTISEFMIRPLNDAMAPY